MMITRFSSTVSGKVLEMLNWGYTGQGVTEAIKESYLEDDVLLEDMLDTGDLILGFAFGKLGRRCTAVEDRPIVGEIGHSCELGGIGGTSFLCGWRWRAVRCLRSRGNSNGVQRAWSY